jgi:hypothetical protein
LQKRKIAGDAAAGTSGDRDPHGGIVTNILKFSKRFRPPEIKARSGGSVINLGSWRRIAFGVKASGRVVGATLVAPIRRAPNPTSAEANGGAIDSSLITPSLVPERISGLARWPRQA